MTTRPARMEREIPYMKGLYGFQCRADRRLARGRGTTVTVIHLDG
jgi:hypothetical protein